MSSQRNEINASILLILERNNLLNPENRAIITAHSTPITLASALSALQQAGIFTQENFAVVANNVNPADLADALSALYKAGIISQENFAIVSNHANPVDLADALSALHQARILSQENFAIVSNHANPVDLADALSALHQARILSQENFAIVSNHANSVDLADALCSLQQVGILSQDSFALVRNHTSPEDLGRAFYWLRQAGILSQENFAIVANHASPEYLAAALCSLQQVGILSQDSFALVRNHTSPEDLGRAFYWLRQAGILSQENFAIVANHASPFELANVLSTLHQAGILNEENSALLANHAYPPGLSTALYYFQQAGILSQENFAIVANHVNPRGLASVLPFLQQARILTQDSFSALIVPNHAALVSQEANQLIWYRIPHYCLTQANFERLVIASEHANPMAELERVRNQILGVEARAGHAAPFNQGQSTHTASVHRSVSESAVKLLQSYSKHLDIETVIKDIIAFINSLDSSFTHDAAKRCIARITAPFYTFTDSSGVSTRQLLALAYTAIHDETKRKGTLEDALSLFVEGLYEIQRGYNLNEQGIDNKAQEDSPICLAGTFNKLMEKLNGIHPDVEVYFITHQGAYHKFPNVVKEHALNYLNRLVCPETVTAYLSTKELLDSIQNNGLEPIWDKIKEAVKAELWSEFKEAYANNPNHQEFINIIDNGSYSNAPDLSELYSKLEASPGYQEFLYQLEQKSLQEQTLFLRLHQHSLWANRHENANTQHDFDTRYGLVIIPSK